MIFAIAIGWLPLVLITLLFTPRAVFGLLTDYPVNARTFVAVPALLAGQLVMETALRTVPRHIRDAALLTPLSSDHLHQTLVRLIGLRDSVIPEVLIAVAVYPHVAQLVKTHRDC